MNEYPEWLTEKIADIVVEFAPENPPGVQQMWSYGTAERILDVLGFAPWGGPTYWRSDIQWEAK